MARRYGQVHFGIWEDRDFRGLDVGPQRLYLFLISQPNINYAGVLSISSRRWAARVANYSEKQLLEDLQVLIDRRYVIVDNDEEELLVRTYIRNDGLWRNPKTMKSASRDALTTASPTIRRSILEELERLPVDELPDKTRKSITDEIKDLGRRLTDSLPTPSLPHSDPVATPSPGAGQGVASGSPPRSYGPVAVAVVGEVLKDRTSVTLGQDPLVLVDNTSSNGHKPEPGSDQDHAFVAFWTAYPKKVGKPSGRRAWKAALKRGANPQQIIAAAERFRDDPQRPRDDKYIPHPSTWLNDERYATQPEPHRVRHWDDVEETTAGGWNV